MIKKIYMLCIIFIAIAVNAKVYNLVTLDYPPYEYDEDGIVKGIATEIVTEVFKRMGDEVKISILPWKRSLEMVKSGQADAIYTAYYTNERAKFLDYSTEILMPQKAALFVLAKSSISYSGDLNKLKDHSFGTVLGLSYGEKFDNFVKNSQIKLNTLYDGESNIRGLLTGMHQIMISNELGAKTILKKMNKTNDVKMLKPVIQDVPSFIAFSKVKNLNKTKADFDRTLKQLKADGTYDKIIKKYI